jgi:cathepsin B
MMSPTLITLVSAGLAPLLLSAAGGAAAALPVGFDASSASFARAHRARIVARVNGDPASSWEAAVDKRFEGTAYLSLLADGAGILGGDPRENLAGLPTKRYADLAPRAGLGAAAAPPGGARSRGGGDDGAGRSESKSFNFNAYERSTGGTLPRTIPEAFNAYERWPQCPSIKQIQDQSACGSCYAVSTASAASDRFCIAKNGTASPRLSALDLMSCCFTCKGANGGCYGGTPSHCWDYMTQQGIASGSPYGDHSGCLMYPFPKCSHHINGTFPTCPAKTDTSPTCFWKCDPDSTSTATYDESQAAHVFGTSYKVDANVSAIQADIMAHGPVNAGMFLVAEFEVYKSGVFSTTSAAYIGAHAVTIVGWGTDTNSSGKDYWLVRNSWNDEWCVMLVVECVSLVMVWIFFLSRAPSSFLTFFVLLCLNRLPPPTPARPHSFFGAIFSQGREGLLSDRARKGQSGHRTERRRRYTG